MSWECLNRDTVSKGETRVALRSLKESALETGFKDIEEHSTGSGSVGNMTPEVTNQSRL